MGFITTTPEEINKNVFKTIGRQWMLISAGDEEKMNTMTASWGGLGVLWNKNVCFTFIRDSRYTLEFIDSKDYFSLSFFGGEHMDELVFCGRNSGRNTDKLKETGLTAVYDLEAPYFEQAEMVMICKKLYKQKMNAESFIDKTLVDKNYTDNDWHEFIVGEIVKVLKKG